MNKYTANKTTSEVTRRPIKENGYSNRIRNAKADKRRDSANKRELVYGDLSLEQKITKAQSARGKSTRQLAQLNQINTARLNANK